MILGTVFRRRFGKGFYAISATITGKREPLARIRRGDSALDLSGSPVFDPEAQTRRGLADVSNRR
jgi:hypothetical protein